MASSAVAQRGYDRSTRQPADDKPSVPGFGHVEGTRPIPGFGTDAVQAVRVTQEDAQRAAERMKQYDTNRDGYVDRSEASRGRWRDDPFQYDRNRDNRLSRSEMEQRYAVRRVREAAARSPAPSGSRPSSDRSQEQARQEQERRERERQAREEAERRRERYRANRGSWYLAESLMKRHDLNGDGRLDSSERRNMGFTSTAADADGDRRIDRSELAQWLIEQELQRQRGSPRELPPWFAERDADQDGQISMAEFTDEWTDDEYAKFGRLDLNEDGVIVPNECLAAMNRLSAKHSNQKFEVIPTRGVVRSEIDVKEDKTVKDLDVQLSITHTHDDHLNAFLIGPADERVELFTGVGGEDDHFENTILDNEAPTSIVRARPPFAGSFQPEEVAKGQPGLKQFYGHSTAGTWTLLIEAKSDRPGALHGWSLIFATGDAEMSTDEEELDQSEYQGSSPVEGRDRVRGESPEEIPSRRPSRRGRGRF